jgi:hypothetical protein
MYRLAIVAALAVCTFRPAFAQVSATASAPAPVNQTVGALEPEAIPDDEPSLHCIGVRWFVRGDDNHNAAVKVAFVAKADKEDWQDAMPLFRVESAALEDRRPPEGVTLFAGSIFGLDPGREYRVRLRLEDPDGGSAERTIPRTTWTEPVAPAPKRTIHVTPGKGGGTGTVADPLRGLRAASAAARPGDLVILEAGEYEGPLPVITDGTADEPIVFRGPARGQAVIKGPADGTAIDARRRKYVFIEKLAIRGANQAMAVDAAERLVIRGCDVADVTKGISDDQLSHRLFLADNVLVGRHAYGQTTNVEDRGIELSGTGHVICYNSVSRFKDAIDTRNPWPVRDVDIHNNDCFECGDDGIELDFSEHNVRAYDNRLTNCALGISFQPSRGGPNYAIRNILYNIRAEAFKLHLTPTNRGAPNWKEGPHRTAGGVLIHNTVIKKDTAFRVWSDEGPADCFYSRNNLLVGLPAAFCIEIGPPMRWADFDYDVFVAEHPTAFALWNDVRYQTLAEFQEATGEEPHGKLVDGFQGVFAKGVEVPTDAAKVYPPSDNAPQLAPDSPAVDAGQVLPNVNNDYTGKAPDAGAWELGVKPPHYGPRSE